MLAEAGSPSAAKTRVLVVEDDRASRSALMSLLRLTGFEPIPAATIAEGLALLDKGPQVVLLDLMLPDGNGGTILSHIRKSGLAISVALTTGASDWQAMLADVDAPPDAVFPKPLDFKRLTDWLHSRVA